MMGMEPVNSTPTKDTCSHTGRHVSGQGMTPSYNVPADTEQKQELFLKAIARVKTLRKASELTGVSRNTVRRWRDENVNGFRERFADACEDYIESLEDKMYELIGEMRVGHNPTLLIFALKALRPDTYRDLSTVPNEGARDLLRKLEQWQVAHSEKVESPVQKAGILGL